MDQQEDKINDATTWQTLQTKTVRRQCRRANVRPIGLISTASQENYRPPKQKRLWNVIKSVRKEATGIAPLKGNGRLFNSLYDKANILNQQYQAQFTREDPDSEVPTPDGDSYPQMADFTVTDDGLKKLLRKSNPNKAVGPDMIPSRLLQECAEELVPILTVICNKSLQTGTVPSDWKQANVSAVFKKGQRYDSANYRPVLLTCLCCKIMEHVIVSNVMKHVDNIV